MADEHKELCTKTKRGADKVQSVVMYYAVCIKWAYIQMCMCVCMYVCPGGCQCCGVVQMSHNMRHTGIYSDYVHPHA